MEDQQPFSNEEFRQLMKKLEADNAGQEKYAKKQYRMSQITAWASIMILVIVLYTCSIIIPRMDTLFGQMESVMYDVESVTSKLAKADWNQMIDDMNHLVQTSEKSVQEALDTINAIDIETLNQAIEDLSNVIAPISKLFGK